MAEHSLRSFAARLEAEGALHEVRRPVDGLRELACIARWAAESAQGDRAYAIRFTDVVGHDMPVLVGLFGSHGLLARSLAVTPAELWPRWSQAIAHPLAPVRVEAAAVQELVWQGDALDLGRLPIPVWTPGRDRAPYIVSGCVITQGRGDGTRNVGTYRIEVQGPRQLGLSFGSPRQHGAMHLASWEEANAAMPVAIVVGAPPAVCQAAAAKVRYGVDELAIAGGLVGAPLSVVGCTSHALEVPADAELVIEGFVRPHERAPEGPFGEALGYMEDVGTAAVIDVACVTMRRGAQWHGLVQQLPPSEGHLLMEAGLVGPLWHYLRDRMRIEGLVDAAIVPGAAGVSMIALAVRQGDRAAATAVLRAMKQLGWGQKLVVVVDDDIDVRDAAAVSWALSSRVDFACDLELQPDAALFQRDPSVWRAHGLHAERPADGWRGTKLLVDATLRGDGMAIALPLAADMERARTSWDSTGLPPLVGVARIERLLAQHPGDGIAYRWPRR